MPLIRYDSTKSMNIEILTDSNSGLWAESTIYPGLHYLRLRGDTRELDTDAETKAKMPVNVDDVHTLYFQDEILDQAFLDPTSAEYGRVGLDFDTEALAPEVKYGMEFTTAREYDAGDLVYVEEDNYSQYVCVQASGAKPDISNSDVFVSVLTRLPLGKDRDTWKSNKEFKRGDLVINAADDKVYFCINDHQSSTENQPGATMTGGAVNPWIKITEESGDIIEQFRSYMPGQMVAYGGSFYICVKYDTSSKINDEKSFCLITSPIPFDKYLESSGFYIGRLYTKGSLVLNSDDKIYIALKDVTASEETYPQDDENNENWLQVTTNVQSIYGLSQNQWAFEPSEGMLRPMVTVQGSRWEWDCQYSKYYYNNGERATKYKLHKKPKQVWLRNKKLREITAGSSPAQLVSGTWLWAPDPTGNFDTIWIGVNLPTDPDKNTDPSYISILENEAPNTIYTTAYNPNSGDFYIPGEPIEVIPSITNGTTFLNLSTTVSNLYANKKATMTIYAKKTNGDNIVLWSGDVAEKQVVTITDPFVLNPTDSLGINSNIPNCSVSISGSLQSGSITSM